MNKANFYFSWILALSTAVAIIAANSIFTPSLAYIARDLGVEEEVAASNMAICRGMMIICMFTFGAYSNLFTSRRLMQGALAIGMLSCAISASAVNITMFNMAQGVEAVSRAMIMLTVQLWIAGISNEKTLTTRLGLYAIIITIAPIGAPTIGGLVADCMSWRWSFVFLGILMAVMLILLSCFRIEEAEPSRKRFNLKEKWNDYKDVIIHSPILKMTASVCWMAWIDGAYMAIVSFMFVDELGLKASSLGMIILTYVIGAFAGRFPVMYLQKHYSQRATFLYHQIVVLIATVGGAAWYFMTGSHSIIEIAIVMALFGFGFSGLYIYSLGSSMLIDNERKSVFASVFNSAYNVAAMLGVVCIQILYGFDITSIKIYQIVLCVATVGMLICIPLHLSSLKKLSKESK